MESEEELYAAYSISDPTLQNVDTMMPEIPCDNAILTPDITQPSQEPTCDNIGLMQQNILEPNYYAIVGAIQASPAKKIS